MTFSKYFREQYCVKKCGTAAALQLALLRASKSERASSRGRSSLSSSTLYLPPLDTVGREKNGSVGRGSGEAWGGVGWGGVEPPAGRRLHMEKV